MIICESCGHENFEGLIECEECQTPLDETHLLPPTNVVERSLLKDRVSVLNPKTPITVAASATVDEVMQTLVDRQIGCVVVVHDGKTVGIFSERDVLIRLNDEAPDLKDRPVADFMTPNPRTLPMDAKIAFAARSMDLGGYRHVPIVDPEGNLCGIISARDILRYLADKMTSGNEPVEG